MKREEPPVSRKLSPDPHRSTSLHPLHDPNTCPVDFSSWLLDLTATALLEDPKLSNFAGRVSDSGEGRWTIKAAIDEAVPAPVLTSALSERFSSRGEADFANKLLSAMRYQFGGHLEKSDSTSEVP